MADQVAAPVTEAPPAVAEQVPTAQPEEQADTDTPAVEESTPVEEAPAVVEQQEAAPEAAAPVVDEQEQEQKEEEKEKEEEEKGEAQALPVPEEEKPDDEQPAAAETIEMAPVEVPSENALTAVEGATTADVDDMDVAEDAVPMDTEPSPPPPIEPEEVAAVTEAPPAAKDEDEDEAEVEVEAEAPQADAVEAAGEDVDGDAADGGDGDADADASAEPAVEAEAGAEAEPHAVNEAEAEADGASGDADADGDGSQAAGGAAAAAAVPTPAVLQAALSALPPGVDPSQLVNMLFNEESSDDEEFAGFGVDEIAAPATAKKHKSLTKGKKRKKRSREEGEGSQRPSGMGPLPDNDYEAMLAKRKFLNKRKKNNGERTDLDEMAKKLKDSMFDAAEDDKVLNEQHKPATKKLQLLPSVVQQLRNVTLQQVLIENGILQAVAAWLQPMPDRSLPSVQLRDEMIRILEQLPDLHSDDLKDSGIGKACMLLMQHPKENKENKARLQKLVQKWARLVLKLHSDFKHVRQEERMEQLQRVASKRKAEAMEDDQQQRALRPGDQGFVWRARVPQPKMRDYVHRPSASVDDDPEKGKKQVSRLEKLQRRHRDGQLSSQRHKQHAVGINLSGSFAGNK